MILSKSLKQKTFIFLLVLHVCGVHACMDTYMFCVVEACGGQDVSSTLHPLYRGGVSHLNAELARTTSLASRLAFGVPSLCLLSARITGGPPHHPRGNMGPGTQTPALPCVQQVSCLLSHLPSAVFSFLIWKLFQLFRRLLRLIQRSPRGPSSMSTVLFCLRHSLK